ncbi:MAG: hypothetical protein QM500_20985 [Methylococcales bacterium]
MLLDDTDVQYFLQVHEEIGQISGSDVAVSCPQCREGKSWGRKHRLHLYIKPSYDTASVHCWNCGYASNIYGYLKEFFPQEFSSYRKAKAASISLMLVFLFIIVMILWLSVTKDTWFFSIVGLAPLFLAYQHLADFVNATKVTIDSKLLSIKTKPLYKILQPKDVTINLNNIKTMEIDISKSSSQYGTYNHYSVDARLNSGSIKTPLSDIPQEDSVEISNMINKFIKSRV